MAPKTKSATKGGSKRDKPPPLDQYIKPIIGVVVAIVCYYIFRGMIAKEILRVDISSSENELELRELLFGEDITTGTNTNYATLCYPSNAIYPISSVFQDAANDGSAPCQFRLLDCDTSMLFTEEKKTVMERFSKTLTKKTKPIIFVSGSIGPPKQVPAKFLKTGKMLTKALKNLLEPRSEKIETTQDLRSKCLEKDVCALLLKGSKVSPKYVKDAITKLVVEYPAVTFAAVDTSVLYVKGLEAEFLSELIPGMPRFIVFKKTSGTTDKSKTDNSRLKTTAIALDVDVAYGPMSNLVASVTSGSKLDDIMTKVSTTPTIKTRTKKLEKEENAKRQRRKNREEGGGSGSSSSDSGSSSGAFTGENDGSAEGRKAERDRRRDEHRKSNPNYKEKTPEEIKEIERQRRIRMEAEAEKWNMSPEDGEDGEDGGSGGSGDYMEDNEDWDQDENENDSDNDDDEEDLDLDGEEVLDLD